MFRVPILFPFASADEMQSGRLTLVPVPHLTSSTVPPCDALLAGRAQGSKGDGSKGDGKSMDTGSGSGSKGDGKSMDTGSGSGSKGDGKSSATGEGIDADMNECFDALDAAQAKADVELLALEPVVELLALEHLTPDALGALRAKWVDGGLWPNEAQAVADALEALRAKKGDAGTKRKSDASDDKNYGGTGGSKGDGEVKSDDKSGTGGSKVDSTSGTGSGSKGDDKSMGSKDDGSKGDGKSMGSKGDGNKGDCKSKDTGSGSGSKGEGSATGEGSKGEECNGGYILASPDSATINYN
jgi:hypothetical protein